LSKNTSAAAAQITTEDVKRLARLAYLDPSPDQLEQIKKDVANILVCVDQMQRVDTTNVKPLTSVLENTRLKRREDVSPEGVYDDSRPKVVLANAKQKGGSFFAVPKQKDPFEGDF
jgi:aspartyl-tRNA(Asn)/glutamyl-tRNA(Gln) amidotransferase subunit C